MKSRIIGLIRLNRWHRVDLADLGADLGLPPAQLLPLIDELRRDGILGGSAREGRYGITAQQLRYTTSDHCGVVSLRDQ